MKDVVSCDKPRRGAHNLRSGDFRMGQPILSNVRILLVEYIDRVELTEGTETSKYLLENKTKVIPKVAASEMGRA
jgi:hypothetical protein